MANGLEQVLSKVRRADRAGALALASECLANGERHPLILMLAAEQLEQQGKLGEAVALLEEALRDADGEPELWRRYGVALGKLGLLPQSRAALEEAHDIAPEQPEIRLALATICYQLGDLDIAAEHFRSLAAAAPQQAEPIAALAAIAAQRGDFASAEAGARQALALAPDNVPARIALARAALGASDAARAEALAGELLDKLDPGSSHRVALLGLRADARDALGRHADAFGDYSARNALLSAQFEPAMANLGRERPVDQARRLGAWLGSEGAQGFGEAPSGDDPFPRTLAGHLFIVGFPRSGTTLLEKALAGHGSIRTLPEIDCLGDLAGEFLSGDDGMDRLVTLAPERIAALRQSYLEAVTGAVGDVSGKVLVDKLPLHTIHLPVIARLFPGARIVLSLRDPRDVVLSGFRRRFQMNLAMAELLTLQGAAEFYDAVMALAVACRRVLPLDFLEVRHEDLVGDFQNQVSRVLALAGLDWESPISAFADRAATQARTPSDYQLVRGLNRDGIGAWGHYTANLAPVRPLLDPWAARWGYPAD